MDSTTPFSEPGPEEERTEGRGVILLRQGLRKERAECLVKRDKA